MAKFSLFPVLFISFFVVPPGCGSRSENLVIERPEQTAAEIAAENAAYEAQMEN